MASDRWAIADCGNAHHGTEQETGGAAVHVQAIMRAAWRSHHPMRHIVPILIALLAGGAAAPAVPASKGYQHPDTILAATKTGKERLSDKGSDEQRQDDCKVPQVRRTKARPANCGKEH